MLRPHDRENAQFREGGRASEPPLDLAKFGLGKSMGRSLSQVHLGLAG